MEGVNDGFSSLVIFLGGEPYRMVCIEVTTQVEIGDIVKGLKLGIYPAGQYCEVFGGM